MSSLRRRWTNRCTKKGTSSILRERFRQFGFGVLDVRWQSSIDGDFLDPGPLDAEGVTGFSTASLSPGLHVITLSAIDEDAEKGEHKITVEVKEVPEALSTRCATPSLAAWP